MVAGRGFRNVKEGLSLRAANSSVAGRAHLVPGYIARSVGAPAGKPGLRLFNARHRAVADTEGDHGSCTGSRSCVTQIAFRLARRIRWPTRDSDRLDAVRFRARRAAGALRGGYLAPPLGRRTTIVGSLLVTVVRSSPCSYTNRAVFLFVAVGAAGVLGSTSSPCGAAVAGGVVERAGDGGTRSRRPR